MEIQSLYEGGRMISLEEMTEEELVSQSLEGFIDPEQELEQRELSRVLYDEIDSANCSQRDKDVVLKRLLGMTRREIGEGYGITGGRVLQLENRALGRLRGSLRLEELYFGETFSRKVLEPGKVRRSSTTQLRSARPLARKSETPIKEVEVPPKSKYVESPEQARRIPTSEEEQSVTVAPKPKYVPKPQVPYEIPKTLPNPKPRSVPEHQLVYEEPKAAPVPEELVQRPKAQYRLPVMTLAAALALGICIPQDGDEQSEQYLSQTNNWQEPEPVVPVTDESLCSDYSFFRPINRVDLYNIEAGWIEVGYTISPTRTILLSMSARDQLTPLIEESSGKGCASEVNLGPGNKPYLRDCDSEMYSLALMVDTEKTHCITGEMAQNYFAMNK